MSPNWRYAYDRPALGALARPTVLRPRDLLRFLGGFGAVNTVADLASFAVLALALHGPDTWTTGPSSTRPGSPRTSSPRPW